MFDFIIENVNIIDGSNTSIFQGAVAVKDGRIAEVFQLKLPFTK